MTNPGEEHMRVGRGMLAISSRCWTRKSEGMIAGQMLKSGCSAIVIVWDKVQWNYRYRVARVLCFYVFSLFEVMPLVCRIRQAFTNMYAISAQWDGHVNVVCVLANDRGALTSVADGPVFGQVPE